MNEKRSDIPEGEEKKREESKPERGHNWITDIYDRMNVSVKTLDVMIVVLCALILFLCVFGSRLQLGVGS